MFKKKTKQWVFDCNYFHQSRYCQLSGEWAGVARAFPKLQDTKEPMSQKGYLWQSNYKLAQQTWCGWPVSNKCRETHFVMHQQLTQWRWPFGRYSGGARANATKGGACVCCPLRHQHGQGCPAPQKLIQTWCPHKRRRSRRSRRRRLPSWLSGN